MIGPHLASVDALSRREFLSRVAGLGIGVCGLPSLVSTTLAQETAKAGTALAFPGPWQFLCPKAAIILVSDQQLDDLREPDKQVDLSLSGTPNWTTLRKVCEGAKAQGARTVILAFDEFWSQYRKGQGGKPRQWMPDMEGYVQRLARISQTLKTYGLGLELSLLSPLEVGRGYERKTGESGRWVQYREGYRDPVTGQYSVSLWEQQRWTNNKGTIELKRIGVRVLAFREERAAGTSYYRVAPETIVDLPTAPVMEVDGSAQPSTAARRLTIRGSGDKTLGALNRVLVLVSYATPEMDYFSPKALPFLRGLIDQYHQAGIPLNGLYADEMHIQQDWGYVSHHDEGQFAFRFLTPHLAERFADRYGAEFKDLEKYLVYFCYGQHGFLPSLEARLPAHHVFDHSPAGIHKALLLRRRYFDLLEETVTELFGQAKDLAEAKYGHELEARAHATWAQSPTCDAWETAAQPLAPRQYEYTPDFLWSNTVQQAAAACSDYFAWNRFLTGGGNDHAEGGWLDRNYYGIALACSTGLLNRTPYAYAAAWGAPGEVLSRHQAVCDAFGASANPWFQAVQDCQHRDVEVLMLYPLSLVAAEERFGSWVTQYGYANYVSPKELLKRARVIEDGQIEMAGRRFGTLVTLFEPAPPAGLLEFMERFVERGGTLIWSGPPPRLDMSGQPVLERWQRLLGIKELGFSLQGQLAAGWQIRFSGALQFVPPQSILTDFLVDWIYPVAPAEGNEVVAQVGRRVVGVRRRAGQGTAVFLGCRPRDDQAASLGQEVRSWFEILSALGAYPSVKGAPNDNPTVISRNSPCAVCRFPNGTTALAAHYHSIEECWPGGFHRDEKQDADILRQHPLPSPALELRDFRVNGHVVSYQGQLAMAFRVDNHGVLQAFAGHGCRALVVDGREYSFANNPLALLAWAPVLPARRTAGGAVLELWVHGDGEVSIPLPTDIKAGVLHFQGTGPGDLGEKLPCQIAEGRLRLKAQAQWPQKHLFLVPPA